MQEALDRRAEDFTREQPNRDHHHHDADNFVHCTQFATIMQKLAQAESDQDSDEDLWNRVVV